MLAVMSRSGWKRFGLYGSFMGVHNPREYQHVDLGGLGAQKRPCAGVRGRPGGQDIVDQDHPAALQYRIAGRPRP